MNLDTILLVLMKVAGTLVVLGFAVMLTYDFSKLLWKYFAEHLRCWTLLSAIVLNRRKIPIKLRELVKKLVEEHPITGPEIIRDILGTGRIHVITRHAADIVNLQQAHPLYRFIWIGPGHDPSAIEEKAFAIITDGGATDHEKLRSCMKRIQETGGYLFRIIQTPVSLDSSRNSW